MIVFIPAHGRREVIEPLIAAFQAAGATDPSSARPLQELGLEETDIFTRLAEDGLFRSAAPGRWYLDQDALSDLRDARRLQMLLTVVAGAIAAAIGVLALFLTRARP